MKRTLTHKDIQQAAQRVATDLCKLAVDRVPARGTPLIVYPVPRGGVPALYAITAEYNSFEVVRRDPRLKLRVQENSAFADVVVDDLVDSGTTRERYTTTIGLPPGFEPPVFMALFDKTTQAPEEREWLIFPWEGSEEKSIDDAFTRILQFIGEDPARGGLVETPGRMAKAWTFWSSGYKADALSVLKTFEDGAEGYDEMIHSGVIPFYSQCEHHCAPFFGTVEFAYIPDKRIVGLSKMKRLIDVFARRLQVQERLTVQIVNSFVEHVKPLGCACVIKARHMCMESRGIQQQGIITTTSALRGVFKTQPETRAEFYALSNGH